MYRSFSEFGISDEILTSISDMGFEEPTLIQQLAIPIALRGSDIIGHRAGADRHRQNSSFWHSHNRAGGKDQKQEPVCHHP